MQKNLQEGATLKVDTEQAEADLEKAKGKAAAYAKVDQGCRREKGLCPGRYLKHRHGTRESRELMRRSPWSPSPAVDTSKVEAAVAEAKGAVAAFYDFIEKNAPESCCPKSRNSRQLDIEKGG